MLTLGACGGSDDSSDDSSTDAASGSTDAGSISKADFIEQADAICEAGDDATDELPDPTTEEVAIDLIVSDIVPSIRGQISDIRDLGFPEGDEELLDGILTDAEDLLDQIEADPAAFLTADSPFADTNAALTEYGITECADA
ncbi:unannotated protein [freshwater metagenome]|uniref:Unannotated protein n=1 Tax=freshwater metagenome TaxID=449393 RepID=A0A6J6PN09_9ZZZZ